MSLRRLIATGLVVGMLATAATGCSANTPERNQGNRNGQRVADAVNRRPDSYTGRTNRGLFGGMRNNNDGTGINNRAARRSTFGRPDARIGNTFRYGNRYQMNRTDRGISGMNRGRGNNGVGLANTETVPVFFNKKQEAPQHETAPAPEVNPAPAN